MRIEKTETTIVARDVLRVIAATYVDGKLVPPGKLIEVDSTESSGLLTRGLVVRATAEELTEGNVIVADRSRYQRPGRW